MAIDLGFGRGRLRERATCPWSIHETLSDLISILTHEMEKHYNIPRSGHRGAQLQHASAGCLFSSSEQQSFRRSPACFSVSQALLSLLPTEEVLGTPAMAFLLALWPSFKRNPGRPQARSILFPRVLSLLLNCSGSRQIQTLSILPSLEPEGGPAMGLLEHL